MDYIYYCLGILTLLTLGITFQSSIYKSAADDLDQHNLTDYIDTYRSVKDEFNRLKNLKESEKEGKPNSVSAELIPQLGNALSWFQETNTVLSKPRELGEWENFIVSHKIELDTLKVVNAKYIGENRGRQPESEIEEINLKKYDILASLERIREKESRRAELLQASENANAVLSRSPGDDHLIRGLFGIIFGAVALALRITKVSAKLCGHS